MEAKITKERLMYKLLVQSTKKNFMLSEKLKATNKQRNELLKAVKYYVEGINHFYSCMNFNSSNMDAKAIAFMNEVGTNFKEAIKSTEIKQVNQKL